MRVVTLSQWERMNGRQRSWLVAHALGDKLCVFWHCTQSNGERVGGSYRTRQQCEDFIHIAQELTEEQARHMRVPFPHPMATCKPVPTASYPMYAEYDHVAMREGIMLLEKHGSFSVETKGDHIAAKAGCVRAFGQTIQEAVGLLILMLHGYIYQPQKKRRAA